MIAEDYEHHGGSGFIRIEIAGRWTGAGFARLFNEMESLHLMAQFGLLRIDGQSDLSLPYFFRRRPPKYQSKKDKNLKWAGTHLVAIQIGNAIERWIILLFDVGSAEPRPKTVHGGIDVAGEWRADMTRKHQRAR